MRLGADLVDRKFEPQEERLEIIVTDLGDFGWVDLDMLDMDLRLVDQPLEIEAERIHIRDNVDRTLLEGHEDPGLVVQPRAVEEEGRSEQCLAAAGRAADKRWPSRGKAAKCQIVKAVDASCGFRDAFSHALSWFRAFSKQRMAARIEGDFCKFVAPATEQMRLIAVGQAPPPHQ
ncbi:hypothetical protein ABH994_006884 [Bradyrhizobium yuanmingense]